MSEGASSDADNGLQIVEPHEHKATADHPVPDFEPRRVWEPPRLMTGYGWEAQEQARSVSWLELFYDLLYVAAAINTGHILKHELDASSVGSFIVLCVTLWTTWATYTNYYSRFTGDSCVHELFFLLHALGVLGMVCSITAEDHGMGLRPQFLCCLAVSRLSLIVPYVMVLLFIPEAWLTGFGHAMGLAVSGLVCLMAGLLPRWEEPVTEGWFVGVLVVVMLLDSWELCAYITIHYLRKWKVEGLKGRANRIIPFHIEHYNERNGLLVMILLGETIVSLATLAIPVDSGDSGAAHRRLAATTGPPSATADAIRQVHYVCVALAYAVLYCLKMFYYLATPDLAWHALGRYPWWGLLWCLCHMLLFPALVALGVSFALIIKHAPAGHVAREEAWLCCGALFACLMLKLVVRCAHFLRPFLLLICTAPATAVRLHIHLQLVWWLVGGGLCAVPIVLPLFEWTPVALLSLLAVGMTVAVVFETVVSSRLVDLDRKRQAAERDRPVHVQQVQENPLSKPVPPEP